MNQDLDQKKMFIFSKGKMYFSKDTERRICFFLTLTMLISAALFKAGII
ncbi:MAG: hypothetical protein KJ737_06270 [Proteobacteria bacterium]|nr:hypothetical protein [Pseudomonadota bacterium]